MSNVPLRFIPTYVGHTKVHEEKNQTNPVHPHLRGAYPHLRCPFNPTCGSSPPTWGIPLLAGTKERSTRFIPTYVGHTLDRRKKNGWFQPLFL